MEIGTVRGADEPDPEAMRYAMHSLACAALLTFAGCKDEPRPQPPPEAPPAQPEPQGTRIRAGEGGVEIRTEDGGLEVSPDSVNVDVKPK